MASRSVNKVILIGHLGRDAETRFTPSGVARTTFSVATSRRWKDQQTGDWKEETDWHNIVLWRSENVAQYLTKGKQVYIEGRLASRSYDDKDGNKKYVTEVVADELMLLGSQGGRGGEAPSDDMGDAPARPVSMPRSAQRPAAPAAAPAEDFPPGVTDDDVPF
jgi:single-strand DNA-binding protein